MRRFMKLDFWSGSHQHHCHRDTIEKAAFIGPGALCGWLVTAFGAVNAPGEFMRLTADLLIEDMDTDNILVYSRNDEEHERHVKAAMGTIRKAGFRLHGPKCSFGRTPAPFPGFDISGGDPDGAPVHMTHEEVKSIADWPCPASRRTYAASSVCVIFFLISRYMQPEGPWQRLRH